MQKELLYSKKVREETEIQNKATMTKLHRRKCRCRDNLFFSSPWLSTPPFPSLTNTTHPSSARPHTAATMDDGDKAQRHRGVGRDHGVDSLQRSEIHGRRAECGWGPTILQQRWHSPMIMHLLIILLGFRPVVSKKL